MSLVPEMGDHGRPGQSGRLGPQDAAAEGHGLEPGPTDVPFLSRRPAALGPVEEQDPGRGALRLRDRSGQDVLERTPAMLAQKEPPLRPGVAKELLERAGRMDLRQESRLALFRRLPGDPPPAFELAVGPLP